MPVQFGNSKVRQFYHNAPAEATLFSPNSIVETATGGPERGNQVRAFTLPLGSTRRNNAWSRRLANSMRQARKNVRAGINARSMPRSANQALMAGIANEANAKNIAREAAENAASEARRYGSTGSMNSFLSAESNMSNLTGSAAAGNAAPVASSRSLWQQVLAPPVITSNTTSLPNLRVRRSATPRRPSVLGLFTGGRKSRRQTNRRRSHKK
jgi:hypothetical protein